MPWNKKFSLFFFVLSTVIIPVYAQEPLTSEQKAKIAALVTRDVPEKAPGVAFGVVQNGQIIYTQYAGYANLEKELKIDENTRFNIASNAKQYTALAVLKLIEEKKLGLDTDLRKFFPRLFPEVKEKIQIQHLLTHTSGIRDFYDLLALQNMTWWEKSLGNQEVIKGLEKQRTLNFRPGMEYLYSNSNYVLLAEIVAKVSQKPFPEYLNQLFKAMGMPNTRFEPDYTKIREPIARPYFNFDTWTGYEWIWNVVGDGNLFTTLPDQLHFEQLIQTQKLRFLRQQTIEKSQQKLLQGFNYGFGLEFADYRKIPIVFHHGSTGAWKATFLRFPGKQLSLLTLSNSGKTDVVDQNQQIADLLLQLEPSHDLAYLTAPAEEGALVEEKQMQGFFQNTSGTTFQFIKKDHEFLLSRVGRNDIKLERENANVFHQVNDPAFKLEFKQNEQNQWTVTAYYPTHAPYTLTKIEASFNGFRPEALNGTYYNDETEMELKLVFDADNTGQVSIGTYQTKGTFLTPTLLMVDFYTLRFDSNRGIYLDGGRIKNVYFSKKD